LMRRAVGIEASRNLRYRDIVKAEIGAGNKVLGGPDRLVWDYVYPVFKHLREVYILPSSVGNERSTADIFSGVAHLYELPLTDGLEFRYYT